MSFSLVAKVVKVLQCLPKRHTFQKLQGARRSLRSLPLRTLQKIIVPTRSVDARLWRRNRTNALGQEDGGASPCRKMSLNRIDLLYQHFYQKGIEATPKNRYVWQAWALFEAKQGEEDRARKLFQTGRELNPKDAVILQAFALFEYKCGRPLVSRDLFRRALNCDSSHQPVYIAWGWMEWKLGNLSVARDLYQGAIRVDSRSPDAARAFQAWGVLEDRAGDSGLSRELFRCALRVDSQNVPALMSWAAMEDRAGRSVRADEIRLQFLQQRTEVVESSWDVDISDLLAPAIDRIKGFFKGNQRARRSEPEANYEAKKVIEDLSQGLTKVNGENKDLAVQGQDFDVESFLKQKFPQRFGCLERRSSAVNLAQKPID